MRIHVFSLLLVCYSTASLAAECKPPELSAEALKMIKPLMQLRIKQQQEQFTETGQWKGESKYTADVENRFYAILENRTRAGDEALVYLLNVYMGEHAGEALVCEATNRGNQLLPLIISYKKCIPLIGLEPLPKFVQGSGNLPGMVEDSLAKGQGCQFH